MKTLIKMGLTKLVSFTCMFVGIFWTVIFIFLTSFGYGILTFIATAAICTLLEFVYVYLEEKYENSK